MRPCNHQDWFHESCLNLRERPSSREATPQPEESTPPNENDDGASAASSSGLPPPLIKGSSYDCLVCRSCVKEISTLKRWAATPGVLMVVRDNPTDPWKVIGMNVNDGEDVDIHTGDDANGATTGQKRTRSPSVSEEPQAKRVRDSEADPSQASRGFPCLSPTPNSIAQKILCDVDSAEGSLLGSGDIFLTEGWRERWCRCTSVRAG